MLFNVHAYGEQWLKNVIYRAISKKQGFSGYILFLGPTTNEITHRAK